MIWDVPEQTLTLSPLGQMIREGLNRRRNLASYEDISLCYESETQRRVCDSSSFLSPVVSVCVSSQTRHFDPIETSLLGVTSLMKLAPSSP